MKKMLIIDGNSIVNRSFYGIRPLSNAEGFPTNALYGFTNILMKNLQDISPDYAAVAFDLKAPTFRHKMYKDYKAGRHEAPDELKLQLPVSREFAEALGFKVFEKEGYEADDILGTLSGMGDEAGIETYILTGDRDSLQLISDNTKVLLACNNDTVCMDREKFREKYEIEPSQFVDLKAIMGDKSDNIPGVAGIGEKGAVKLIFAEGSLEKLYSGLENNNLKSSLTPGVIKKLTDSKDDAFLSQTLARIDKNVPLDTSLEELAYKGYSDEITGLFIKYGFMNFIKRLNLNSDEKNEEKEKIKKVNADIDGNTAALYFENGKAYVYSQNITGECNDNTVGEILSDKGINKIIFDIKSVYSLMTKRNVEINGNVFDPVLAAYLISPGESVYSLADLCLSYLGEICQDDNEKYPEYVFKLYCVLKDKLKENHLEKLFFEVEMPLSKTLSDMEVIGFKIEKAGLVMFGELLDKRISELTERIYFEAGEEFNINSPKQLSEVLFVKMGLPYNKKTKKGFSTSIDVLEKLRYSFPIVEDILEYRQAAKLKSTYVEGLRTASDENGRVHTTFKQALTATGRLSSTEPNLQNIPVKTELGREMRKFFVPRDENYVLIDADYSQIELRLLAHISNDETMKEAFEKDIDIHTLTASQVFGVPVVAVTPEMRKRAKAVNFGIMYGMGDFSLATDIHVSKKEAADYINGYFKKYPMVDKYLKDVVQKAKSDGYVTTLFGRKRNIPEIKSSKKMLQKFGERVAMNSPIQGTAADIIKIAMINTDKALKKAKIDAHLILQIHDELIVEANVNCKDKAFEILKNEMENAVKLSVPLVVDIKAGKSWYECK